MGKDPQVPNPKIESGSLAVLGFGLRPGRGPSRMIRISQDPIILLGRRRKENSTHPTPPYFLPPPYLLAQEDFRMPPTMSQVTIRIAVRKKASRRGFWGAITLVW